MDKTAQERIRTLVARIERLEEERSGLTADIREVYAEAKGSGFEPKVLRQVVKLRKMKIEDRREQEMLLDTYLNALGMLESAAAE
ncbi:MAG: DUF2312 domain-containing protein [Alphaproteobacteria bacterium]|nr:DUF2312 domain-containing protein [Alphaproteobacteria bacterium]